MRATNNDRDGVGREQVAGSEFRGPTRPLTAAQRSTLPHDDALSLADEPSLSISSDRVEDGSATATPGIGFVRLYEPVSDLEQRLGRIYAQLSLPPTTSEEPEQE